MDYDKIDSEMEPFKENGEVTRKSELDWLQLKQVISVRNNELFIRPDRKIANESTNFKVYEKALSILGQYLDENRRRSMGKMGTKKLVATGEINAEEIPF